MAKNSNCKNCKNWDPGKDYLVPIKGRSILFRKCIAPGVSATQKPMLLNDVTLDATKVICDGRMLTHAKFGCKLHIKK